MLIQKIFENNRKWVRDKLALDKNYFKELSKGQAPEVLYIGCSDSRVSSEELMGAEPGEVFVHRNIANLVPINDLNVNSVINFAVQYLKVKSIVVCGHYFCGGVKAAMEDTNFGVLEPWLKNIRDVIKKYDENLNSIENEDERYKKLVEFNVYEQCLNIFNNKDVHKLYLKKEIHIHGWVFDIRNGKLIDLNIDLP